MTAFIVSLFMHKCNLGNSSNNTVMKSPLAHQMLGINNFYL